MMMANNKRAMATPATIPAVEPMFMEAAGLTEDGLEGCKTIIIFKCLKKILVNPGTTIGA